jgi:hypothetical protein
MRPLVMFAVLREGGRRCDRNCTDRYQSCGCEPEGPASDPFGRVLVHE